jgi:hypothetical protein
MAPAQITVEDRIFSKLKISLERQKSQAAFCCCGASRINNKHSRTDIQFKESPPVILHWASQDGASVQKVVFSKHTSSTDDFYSHIQHLTASCQPASFGKEGKAVIDGEEALYHHQKLFTLECLLSIPADLAPRIVS